MRVRTSVRISAQVAQSNCFDTLILKKTEIDCILCDNSQFFCGCGVHMSVFLLKYKDMSFVQTAVTAFCANWQIANADGNTYAGSKESFRIWKFLVKVHHLIETSKINKSKEFCELYKCLMSDMIGYASLHCLFDKGADTTFYLFVCFLN